MRVTNAFGSVDSRTVTVSLATANPPTGLYAVSIAGNVVTLRWTAPASGLAPTDYLVRGGVAPQQTLASLPTGSAVPVFTFTAPTGVFFVRVHTRSDDSVSDASNEIVLFVNAAGEPSPPDNLQGLVNGSTVTLAWRNTFGLAAAQSMLLEVGGAITTSVPLPVSERFTFSGVPPGGYTFRVRAVNGVGVSPPSNAVTLTFPGACAGVPATPDQFIAYRVANTIHVIWEPPTGGPAATGYQITVTGSASATIPTAVRSISGVVGPGSYTLSVRATNACGNGPPTAAQTIVVP